MARERLPRRRRSERVHLHLNRSEDRLGVYVTVGYYDDGRPGEVFIDVMREGHQLRTAYQAWAMNISKMLQAGYKPEELSVPMAGPADHGVVDCKALDWIHGEKVDSVYDLVKSILVHGL